MFQDKQKNQNNSNANLQVAQERIVVKSDGNHGKEVVCLDRVDHINHRPFPGFFNEKTNQIETTGMKDYRVEAQLPYRISDIKFPVLSSIREPEKKIEDEIIVIDSVTEAKRVGAYASHYKMVETVIEHDKKFKVKGFDVSIPNNETAIDYGKYIQILNYLDKEHIWKNSKVINLSFVNEMSFQQINELVSRHFKVENGFKITNLNIHNYSEHIHYAIKEESKMNNPRSEDFKVLLNEIEVLKSLMSKNVAIVIAAGNSGAEKFDIRSAILPDLVIAGGLNGKNADLRSAYNTSIDTWEQFSSEYKISGVDVILEGTSFASPLAAKRIAEWQVNAASKNEHITLKDLNNFLRNEKR